MSNYDLYYESYFIKWFILNGNYITQIWSSMLQMEIESFKIFFASFNNLHTLMNV